MLQSLAVRLDDYDRVAARLISSGMAPPTENNLEHFQSAEVRTVLDSLVRLIISRLSQVLFLLF